MIILITFVEGIVLILTLITTSAFIISFPVSSFVFATFVILLLMGMGGIFVIPVLALVIGFVRWKFKGLNLSKWGRKEKYFFLFLLVLYICVLILMLIYKQPLQFLPVDLITAHFRTS